MSFVGANKRAGAFNSEKFLTTETTLNFVLAFILAITKITFHVKTTITDVKNTHSTIHVICFLIHEKMNQNHHIGVKKTVTSTYLTPLPKK